MVPIRTNLYSSIFWSVSRPKFPLSLGHFVIRLNDPALAFSTESAADLLHCYGSWRRAMTELSGATAAQLYMAQNWQPVGDALGEPLAETSTPTLHVFFNVPGSTTAAAALRLPAHQRVAVEDTADLDEQLRLWRDSVAGEPALEAGLTDSPPSGPEPVFRLEAVNPATLNDGHWMAVPRTASTTIDHIEAESLVELAGAMDHVATQATPPIQGLTVWVTDQWESAVEFHLFARRHGDERQHVANFVADGGLDVPEL
ncbi:hypothetical protein SAMN04489740_3613 [Arthrobacter alpinus]|uniref:Uncharacterized protein n=1 Tax=Arthrobacter alpinus TaxID=656366 RepID=A0A1H5NDT7_9MICC|nr:hypothetical protein [Arthrobacter alpinus]SEE99640.1 hypothetical protein SAMN04489740_3613 [Arthrobacter alpinus]